MPDILSEAEGKASRDDRIRQRAYEIWESEGHDGNPDDHWIRAEQELLEAGQAEMGEALENGLSTDATKPAALLPERLAD